MKRVILSLTALGASIALLTACGSGSSDAADAATGAASVAATSAASATAGARAAADAAAADASAAATLAATDEALCKSVPDLAKEIGAFAEPSANTDAALVTAAQKDMTTGLDAIITGAQNADLKAAAEEAKTKVADITPENVRSQAEGGAGFPGILSVCGEMGVQWDVPAGG
ncbi:hypothetical protein JT358_14720 [Micrococcales bacterium 31B]|nr:hypothetical protein [Micrococcales bacterium 31B]